MWRESDEQSDWGHLARRRDAGERAVHKRGDQSENVRGARPQSLAALRVST